LKELFSIGFTVKNLLDESAILSMRFRAESSRLSGANSPLWSPKPAHQRRAGFGLASKM